MLSNCRRRVSNNSGFGLSNEANFIQLDTATTRIRKARGKRFQSDLMAESDLKRLLAELVDHFSTGDNETLSYDQMLGEDWPAFDDDSNRAEDIGVVAYKNTSLEDLHKLLAFHDGRPIQFSKFRATDDRYDAWEDDRERLWEKGGDGMVEIGAQWHQLTGVCSIVEKIFLDKDMPPKMSHLLIADDVGLGKTVEIMMVLAFLMQVYVCEAEENIENRPPLVSSGK